MPGVSLSIPSPFSSSYARRSPSPLALPSPCRIAYSSTSPTSQSMAQFTSPYANMVVPPYDSCSRREQQDFSDLNHRSYYEMGQQASMDSLAVRLRAEDAMEKSHLAANRFSVGYNKS